MIKNNAVLAVSMAAVIVTALTIGFSLMAAQDAEAQMRNVKLVRGSWVQTSISHNAEGHSAHHVVDFFSPQDGLVYNGKVTFSSSKGVDIIAYHDISDPSMDTTGVKIWKIGDKTYATTTLLTNSTSGTVEFVGSGLLAHAASSDSYKVAFSAEGVARKVLP